MFSPRGIFSFGALSCCRWVLRDVCTQPLRTTIWSWDPTPMTATLFWLQDLVVRKADMLPLLIPSLSWHAALFRGFLLSRSSYSEVILAPDSYLLLIAVTIHCRNRYVPMFCCILCYFPIFCYVEKTCFPSRKRIEVSYSEYVFRLGIWRKKKDRKQRFSIQDRARVLDVDMCAYHAGEGFKFASLIGELLSEFANDSQSPTFELPQAFSPDRFLPKKSSL